jgi:hypothetical protein
MRQWEYLRLDLNAVPRRGNEIDVLNGVGSDGWEIAAINGNGVAILKREIGQPARTVRRKAPEPVAG